MEENREIPKEKARRGFIRKGFAALLGGLFAGNAVAQEAPAPPSTQPKTNPEMSGEQLHTHFRRGNPPVQPLDTMLLFERGDNNNDRPMTHEILSLIHEEKGKNSYPWTIYSSLATSHEVGDACVLCSRLHKNGPGWSCGLHSEVFNHGRMVALGANIEMSNDCPDPEPTVAIGLNIQATHGTRPCQYGIQIHNGDNEKSYFEKGIGLNGKGDVGMELGGKYKVGLDMKGNTIRVSEGTAIELDGEGKIKIRYLNGRIEFLNGDKCFASMDVNGEERKI